MFPVIYYTLFALLLLFLLVAVVHRTVSQGFGRDLAFWSTYGAFSKDLEEVDVAL